MRPKYTARVVATQYHAAKASKAVHTLWPNDPLLDSETYWNIVKHNNNVLVAILDETSKMVGFFDLFPLKDAAVAAFLDGKSDEQSLLTVDTIYNTKSSQRANYVYIGTVQGIPRTLRRTEKMRLEYSMIRTMFTYINDHYPPRPGRSYFAMAATKLGHDWLKKCGFIEHSIPAFAEGKLRFIYSLDSKDLSAAIQRAMSLELPKDCGKIIPIKCQWQKSRLLA